LLPPLHSFFFFFFFFSMRRPLPSSTLFPYTTLFRSLVVLPTTLLWWFRTTRSRVAFAGFLLMNLWIVVGFGLIKGLWKSTLPVFLGTLLASVSTSFPRPTLGPVPFELSGILTFIGSLFVLYYGYRLARANHDAAAGAAPAEPTARRPVLLAASALVAFAVIAGAYAFTDEDRWIAPANGVVKIRSE